MVVANDNKTRKEARRNCRNFTDVLKAHGVEGKGYMLCTEGTYLALFGKRASQLRALLGIPANANLRDHLQGVDLGAVVLAEALAAKHIEAKLAIGTKACVEATAAAAHLVASFVNDDLSLAAG